MGLYNHMQKNRLNVRMQSDRLIAYQVSYSLITRYLHTILLMRLIFKPYFHQLQLDN